MAERGHLYSLTAGSDADFEIKCTPCDKDNIREEADKYCPECQEYLCKTCTRYHGRVTATKEHTLLDKNDSRQALLVTKTKCRYHADRDIEMYCNTHDMVYCAMCIATYHRFCDGVNKIEDVSKENVSQAEIQSLLDETNNAEAKVKYLTDKQKQNLTAISEQRKTIQVKVNDTKTRLIEQIRKLKIKTTECLNDKYSALKENLVSSISESSATAEELKQTQEEVRSIHNLETEQQFIKMTLMKKTVKDANRFIRESETNSTISIEFIENIELTNFLVIFDALGDVTCESVREQKPKQRQPYKIKIKREINVKLIVDRRTCFISDICKLPDGTILLADYDNKRIKRLGSNNCVKDYCDLDAKPTGICCISRNEIAVKISNNKIQFLCPGITLSKQKSIDIDKGGLFGPTSFGGDLWSSANIGINVYSTSRALVTFISKDQSGKSLLGSGVQHMAVSTDAVIVTDSSNGAVCLNKDGSVLKELRDSRLRYTRGVCVADDGTIFLCGCSSNNIVMFSNSGECLGELLGTDSELRSPINMCYDRNRNRLLVSCAHSDLLNVFELVC